MKKLLVVLLAVVMVFGFAATAMAADTLATAYPDLSGKDTTVQDAFMKLSALNVFGGYADGTIKPDANITRAEFAKVACILSGMADSADVLKGNASKFSDVPANQWFTGYVNLATSLEFVSGYPDGTFKPNNYITMQESLTVLLRIAGYNDNLVGPWPMNYIAQGGKLDVTDDVAFAGAAPATRAAIAVMAANVLDINVVYWDTDKSKFVEDTQTIEVIRTKEVDYEEVEVPITVLEDKFGACLLDETYLAGWYFDDFDDQEVILGYADNYFESGSLGEFTGMGDFTTMGNPVDEAELAESYWVSDGLNLSNIYGHQANLILNDDDEVVYVDIISSSEYSDDVTVDDGTVEVDGTSKKVADNYLDIPSNGDYTAQIFYNDDNEIYLVDELYFGDDAPYIFKSYNENKDRIETYYNGDNIDTDLDIAILKDGRFITPADLTDKDVLQVYEDVDGFGADTMIFVFSFSEGELTKGNDTKLTVGGTALEYLYGADYSTDDLETFATLDSPDDVDDAYGTTVQYATTFFNPYDLCLMVFEGGVSNTIYGIITDVSANIDGQVSAITVLGADGEEVEYTLEKGDVGRPEYHNYNEVYDAPEDGFDLTFGTYIEAKVSEDGTIDTDDIALLLDPVFFGDEWWNWDVDLDGYGVFGTDYVWVMSDSDESYGPYDINKNRIQIDGVYYTLTDDTLVFQTTTTAEAPDFETLPAPGEFDEAEVIDVADLMAADEITSGYVCAFIDGGVVKQLFLLNSDLTSTSSYGIIDDVEYRSGDWYATLLGGSEYATGDTSYADYVDTAFLAYTLSGDELSTGDDSRIIWSTSATGLNVNATPLADDEYIYSEAAYSATATLIEGMDRNYAVNDDTVFYTIEAGEFAEGDVYDIQALGEDDATPLLIIADEDDIALYVFVLVGYSF